MYFRSRRGGNVLIPTTGRAWRSPPIAFAVLAALAGPAAAQTVPGTAIPTNIDAGTIGRENQRIQNNTLEQAAPPKLSTGAVQRPERPPAVTFPGGGPTVLLRKVEFSPSAFLSREELDAIAAPFIGKKVDLAQIQQIVNAVNEIYIKRNLVTASADLPPQVLNSGVLMVRLVEGRLGTIKVEGNNRNNAAFYEKRLPLIAGETIDVPKLTSAVNAINRTSEAQLRVALQPGQGFGLTDLTLTAIEPPVNFFQAFGDNFGVPSVGQGEGGLLYRRYGLLGSDDQFTLYGLGAQGNLTGNAAYSIAVTPQGGRIGLSYTRDGIRIVQGPFKTLEITGYAQIGAVNFSQPLFSREHFVVLGVGSVADDFSKTVQQTVAIADNNTVKGQIGLSLIYFDDTYNVTVTPLYGRARSNLAVTQTNTEFDLFNGVLQGSARLPYGFVAQVVAAAQVSSARLLPGDQLFQIGGPFSVRGYSSNAIAGDSGYYAQFELHHGLDKLYKGLEAFAFVDNGNVYSTFPAVTSLTSAGGGLALNIDNRLGLQLFVGVPIKSAIPGQPHYTVYGRATVTSF